MGDEYPKTRELMDKNGISASDVADIVEAYASDMEVAEPNAKNSISAAFETADGIRDLA